MKVVFLGTSGSLPTIERGSSSVVVKRNRDLIMFDCGEGTQRQMVRARVGFRRPMSIFISHLHGDHILGLPGLLQTMSLLQREKTLNVYGPKGLINFVKAFSESIGGPAFPVILYEISESRIIHDNKEYFIKAVRADHRVEGWSYGLIEKDRPGKFYSEKALKLGVPKGPLWHKLQHGETITFDGTTIISSQVTGETRPGLKIVYSGDTRPNNELLELSRDSDLLIHEATFNDELSDRAREDGHSTAKGAAQLAKDANVKKLVLTHISSRYYDASIIAEEAAEIFEDVEVAEDLMEIELLHRD
jgi:ribonuclease Z